MAARSDVSGSPQPPMENSPPSSKHKRDEDMEEEDDLGKSMQDEVGEMLRATVTELEKALQVSSGKTNMRVFLFFLLHPMPHPPIRRRATSSTTETRR